MNQKEGTFEKFTSTTTQNPNERIVQNPKQGTGSKPIPKPPPAPKKGN